MIFSILPVKSPRHAKQRLAGYLSAAEREALARSLFERMLGKMLAARGIHRVAVITSDSVVADHARRAGALVFEEDGQVSHSRSADDAARRAMEMGATTAMLLPIDVPLATVAEIESLAQAAKNGLIIVPSSDGAGTNALVRTPPDVIESRFGPGSFLAHTVQAHAKGIPVEVMRPPGLVFDIDTPEDFTRWASRS